MFHNYYLTIKPYNYKKILDRFTLYGSYEELNSCIRSSTFMTTDMILMCTTKEFLSY
jgi:hypothetical protein